VNPHDQNITKPLGLPDYVEMASVESVEATIDVTDDLGKILKY
jgi:hypothetical protein